VVELDDREALLVGDEDVVLREAGVRALLVEGLLVLGRVAPAVEEGRQTRRRDVAPHAHLAEGLRQDLAEIALLLAQQLRRELGAQIRRRREAGLARAREQRGHLAHRHEERDLFARAGDVHARHLAGSEQRGTAAHAGVERPAEVDARVARVLEQSVVGAVHDAHAEVERIAERVEPLALAERLAAVEREGLPPCALAAQQRQVLHDVEGDELRLVLAAVLRVDLHHVAVGVVQRGRHDVVVRDEGPLRQDREARADAALGGAARLLDLHLHDARGVRGEDLGGGVGLRVRRRGDEPCGEPGEQSGASRHGTAYDAKSPRTESRAQSSTWSPSKTHPPLGRMPR
jgi:hypothetical protein